MAKTTNTEAEVLTPESEVAQPEVASTTATTSPAASSTDSSTTTVKKNHTVRNILLGCGCLLLLCCLLSCALLFLAPGALAGVVASTTAGPDQSLTRVEANELDQIERDLTERLMFNESMTVEFSEKELLASMVSPETGLGFGPNDIALDIEPGTMKLEVSANKLLESSGAGKLDANGTEFSFDGLYFTFDIVVGSDGKSLEATNFSTGNTLLDSILPADVKQEILAGFRKGFTEGIAGSNLSKVELKKDAIAFTYADVNQDL